MSKVYLALPRAADSYLGSVEENGKIFRHQVGPDKEIGHVDLADGEVFEKRFGPDKRIGRVDAQNGRVYLSRLGPDEYVGQVTPDGKMYRHVSMGADDYIGSVDRFVSYAHSAGALLLLVLPALEEDTEDTKDPESGTQ